MNNLELKGGIIEMVAHVDNEDVLKKMYQIMSEIILQTSYDETTLTPEQEVALDIEIEESFIPENLVEHQLVLQKMSRWLNQ